MHSRALAIEVAKRQHLHIARWQLRLLAVSDTALRARVRDHGWRRAHPGVFSQPGTDEPTRRIAAALLLYSRPTGGPQRVEHL